MKNELANSMLYPESSMPVIPFELASLAKAVNYQRWVYQQVQPFIGKRILELGSGIGNMSQWLPTGERLILTENNPMSVSQLDLSSSDFQDMVDENLDTIISFNVLEHIEDDSKCLEQLVTLLSQSRAIGPRRLVTFVPAHSWAYGSMDEEFGHFRRYSKKAVLDLATKVAPDARITIQHFNLVGLLGWFISGCLLRKRTIGSGSIKTFEQICPWIAPIENFIRRLLPLPLGQSILFVLEWPAQGKSHF
jgi:hypothetical protein